MTRSLFLATALFLGRGTVEYAAGPGEEVFTGGKPAPHQPTEAESFSRDWSRLWKMRGSPTSEAPDAGVGEQALTSVEGAPTDLAPLYMLAMKFPKQPWPNQKKPPCAPRAEREVLGACWSILKLEPPCGEEAFDKDGECLIPVMIQGRHPAAEDPQ